MDDGEVRRDSSAVANVFFNEAIMSFTGKLAANYLTRQVLVSPINFYPNYHKKLDRFTLENCFLPSENGLAFWNCQLVGKNWSGRTTRYRVTAFSDFPSVAAFFNCRRTWRWPRKVSSRQCKQKLFLFKFTFTYTFYNTVKAKVYIPYMHLLTTFSKSLPCTIKISS